MLDTDLPGPVNPDCVHDAQHRHGMLASYNLHKCRCADCRAANARYKKATRRNPSQLVDAAPVKLHVKLLREWGYECQQIAEMAGVSESAIQRLLHDLTNGPNARARNSIRRPTAEKILAVSHRPRWLQAMRQGLKEAFEMSKCRS